MSTATTFWIIFSCVSYASSKDEKGSYEGAQVWQTSLRGAKDILLIKKLIDNQDISMWKLTPTRADFLVRPESKVKVHRQLDNQRLNHTVLIMNVQRRMEAEKGKPDLWDENTLRLGHRLTWNKYPTLNIIEEYFTSLSESYSSICTIQNIGYSAENRSIKMITISNGNPDNKVILVTSGMHSREWIAITSALYILNSIVTKFDQQPDFIKNKNWYIIPLTNPDGFEYSRTHDRLWRKNRRKLQHCVGVDVNRNFDTHWNVPGITENNECQEAYAGPSPFSEAESIALRDVVKKSKPSALVDLHSYGQLILYPWSARSRATPDVETHKATANGMSQAMNTTKQKYKFGATYHMVYPATGSALDWIYSSGVTYSFAIEASDAGAHGFLLPSKFIEGTGKEVFGAVRHLAEVLDAPVTHRGTLFMVLTLQAP